MSLAQQPQRVTLWSGRRVVRQLRVDVEGGVQHAHEINIRICVVAIRDMAARNVVITFCRNNFR